MKKIYWIIIAAVFFILYFSRKIINFLVEWMWYVSVNYQGVMYKIILSKVTLFLVSAVIFSVFIYINIYLAEKLKPKTSSLKQGALENIFSNPYIKKINNVFIVLIVAFFSFVFAYEVSSRWHIFQQFLNFVPFGEKDPVFLKDIGFYVFRLPFWKYIYNWTMFLFFMVIIVVGFIYFASSAIQYIGKEVYTTFAARVHLFILVSMLFLLKVIGYRINLYDLLYSEKGVVFGATYIDIYGHKPLYYILAVLCFLCFVIAAANIFIKKAWKIFAVSVIIFVCVSIIGALYPAFLQKFIIKPNEIVKETRFIQDNIKYTRAAYNIDKIKEREFPSNEDISYQNIIDNEATIKNIRLWDYDPILTTYGQLQEIRTYYKFADVDNDRYYIKGKYTQTMLSPRELSSEEISSRIWINEHLTYTHGYGLCMGPVNRVTPEGLPEFFVKDIPPVSLDDVEVLRPEIYFGELSNEYCFVNTKNKEFDYPSGDKNMYCEYSGGGQILVGSIFKKILFALRFSEPKILFSQDITNQSKLMYHRNVMERIRLCAPLIHFDNDIYMIIGKGGGLYWMAEGFTVSNLYPYSQPTEGLGNYIRNSVKAVVNAYTGKIDYYISDKEDPIIKVQSKIFPGVFKSIDQMPKDLKKHIRYPASLFKIQAKIYSLYHMTDTQVFYNKEDLWRISQKSAKDSEEQMAPYYTIMKFPGGEEEEFILMIPFSPANKSNMIAWMAARCDHPNYGGIMAYRFPKKKLVYGPNQIDARIDQDPDISRQLTLWGQGGSKVIRGSLLVIPIEESLIYVEPIYLAAEKGQLPELKRIVVAYKDKIAMEENLETAILAVFKAERGSAEHKQYKQGKEKKQAPSQEKIQTSFKELVNLASDTYDQALDAQKQGNWSLYGEKINDLKQILEEIKRSVNR